MRTQTKFRWIRWNQFWLTLRFGSIGLRRTESPLKQTCLQRFFEQEIPLYVTAVILQEVVQGIRDDQVYEEVKGILLRVPMLRLKPVEAAIGAADLYRSLRKKGVTIRKPNDCLIAHYAIFYGIPVLHSDVDFDQIARHAPLRIAAV